MTKTDGDNPKADRHAKGTFELLNSVADHAHLFSEHEFKMLTKAISHANNHTGLVTLSIASFAKCAGTDTRYAQRVLARLAKRGYLIVLKAGGGRNITATRKVVLPYVDRKRREETPATITVVSDEETPAMVSENHGNHSGNHGNHYPETPATITGGTSHEHLKEQLNSNSTPDSVADAGVLNEIQKEALQALYERDIQDPTATNLVKQFRGLTPKAIAKIARGLSRGAGTGLLVTAIRDNAARVIAEYEARRERDIQRERNEQARKLELAEVIKSGKEAKARHEGLVEDLAAVKREREDKAKEWIAALTDDAVQKLAEDYAKHNPPERSRFMTAAHIRKCSLFGPHVQYWKAANPAEAKAIDQRELDLTTATTAAKTEYDDLKQRLRQLESNVGVEGGITENGFERRSMSADELNEILSNVDAVLKPRVCIPEVN